MEPGRHQQPRNTVGRTLVSGEMLLVYMHQSVVTIKWWWGSLNHARHVIIIDPPTARLHCRCPCRFACAARSHEAASMI